MDMHGDNMHTSEHVICAAAAGAAEMGDEEGQEEVTEAYDAYEEEAAPDYDGYE